MNLEMIQITVLNAYLPWFIVKNVQGITVEQVAIVTFLPPKPTFPMSTYLLLKLAAIFCLKNSPTFLSILRYNKNMNSVTTMVGIK